jgi:hypothetical protein
MYIHASRSFEYHLCKLDRIIETALASSPGGANSRKKPIKAQKSHATIPLGHSEFIEFNGYHSSADAPWLRTLFVNGLSLNVLDGPKVAA